MSNLVVWLVVTGLAFVGFGVLAASSEGMEMRSHFWVRVLFGHVAVLSLALFIVGALVLGVLPGRMVGAAWIVLAVMSLALGPTVCYRRAGSSSGSSDTDGGGDSGPDQPHSPPTAPSGGIPLPDADQAMARVRDHNRPQLRTVKARGRGNRSPLRQQRRAKTRSQQRRTEQLNR
ncbi:MAG: hypothetical protein ACLP01_02390 [Solirubrobacteraceae bacterium]